MASLERANPDVTNEDKYDGGSSVDMTGISLNVLPDRAHPATDMLPEMDFTLLPENFFMIAYGARRTGKTHLIADQLERIKERFDFAYVFSNTVTLHRGEKGQVDWDMVVDDAKFEGFDAEALKAIIDRQRAVKEFNNNCTHERDKKPNRTLLIFDDFVHEKEVRYSKQFTELPVLGRHLDISVICISQGYSAVGSSGLNPATRQNADFVLTFLPRNIGDIERIADWYLAKPKIESMWFVQSVCREKHRALGMMLTEPHLTEYHEYCYKYVAPAKRKKYQVGKVQWDLVREDKKRARYTKLYESMLNERCGYRMERSGLNDVQLNVATGVEKKAGSMRPTLFQAAMRSGVM